MSARTWRDYARFAEALAALGLAAAAIALLRFKRIAAIASRTPARPIAPTEARIAAIRRAIRAGARRVPWRALCFEQALAAQWMLRRRGIATTLHYGIAQDRQTGLSAHVWITAGPIEILGCENRHDFAEIARFPGDAPHH